MKSLLGPKHYNTRIINWIGIVARQKIVLEDDVLRSERHTFFPENLFLFLNQLLIYLTVSTLIIDRSNLEEKMNTYI